MPGIVASRLPVPTPSDTNKTDPRMAMPSADPIWRSMELVPDARPDTSVGTSDRTMLVSCAVAKPTPNP